MEPDSVTISKSAPMASQEALVVNAAAILWDGGLIMSNPTIVSKRAVPNYIPEQTEITEVRFDDGEVAFEGPGGGPIHTYGLELDFWLSVWIGDFRAAVKLLDEDDYLKFGRVFEIMLRAFERNMEEVMHAVYENIGMITCEMIDVNDAPWREGRVVGTEFRPVKKEKVDGDI